MLIYACSLAFLLMASINANPIDKITKVYEEDMRAHAPNYDWSKEMRPSPDRLVAKATEAWDSTPACCGLNGPGDWNRTDFRRPARFSNNLPSSCCIKGIKEQRLCRVDSDAIFQIGCLDSLRIISHNATITISCLLTLYFLLSALAGVLFYFLPVGISEQAKDISAWMKAFASASKKRRKPAHKPQSKGENH